MQKEHVEKTPENINSYFLDVIWNQSVPGAFPGHCMICVLFLARGQQTTGNGAWKDNCFITLLFGTYMFFALQLILVLFVFLSFLCASVIVLYELLLLLIFDIARKRHKG